jgi:hypothetical protein
MSQRYEPRDDESETATTTAMLYIPVGIIATPARPRRANQDNNNGDNHQENGIPQFFSPTNILNMEPSTSSITAPPPPPTKYLTIQLYWFPSHSFFLLVVAQATSFLVLGFSQSKMTGHMPHFFSSKATFEEVRDVNIRLMGMDDSIDGLRRDAESLKLLKGEIQKMQGYMDGALTGTNNDNQTLPNNTKTPKGENPVGEGVSPSIKWIGKGKDIQRY